jgi:hypothetical protein
MSMVVRLFAPNGTRMALDAVRKFRQERVNSAAIGVQLYDTLACGSIPLPLDVQHRAIPRACDRSERF